MARARSMISKNNMENQNQSHHQSVGAYPINENIYQTKIKIQFHGIVFETCFIVIFDTLGCFKKFTNRMKRLIFQYTQSANCEK